MSSLVQLLELPILRHGRPHKQRAETSRSCGLSFKIEPRESRVHLCQNQARSLHLEVAHESRQRNAGPGKWAARPIPCLCIPRLSLRRQSRAFAAAWGWWWVTLPWWRPLSRASGRALRPPEGVHRCGGFLVWGVLRPLACSCLFRAVLLS